MSAVSSGASPCEGATGTRPAPTGPGVGDGTPRVGGRLRPSLRLRRGLRRGRRALRRFRARAREEDARPIAASGAARAALGAAVVVYAAYLSYTTLRIHYGFATFGFDLGIFDQGVWLLSRFERPFVTVRGLHLFGDHTSFVLFALVPFYWVFPSPSVLLVAQSLALAVGAIPTFLIAREKLRSEWIALACASAYLAHPAVTWTNFENFHPDAFEVPLLLLAFYFVVKRRWGGMLACVVAALLVKEDVPLLTFALGVYVAVRHHRVVGLATAALSAAWFAIAVFVVLPAFNEVGTLYASRLPLEQFGGVKGMLKAAVVRPWEIIALAGGWEKAWYVWQLVASLGVLPLLAPGVALIAGGPLLVNLVSTFWYPYQIEYHYSTLIVPVLVVSAIFGIARFRSMRVRGVLAAALVVAAAAGAYLWGPMGADPRVPPDPNSSHAVAAREAISMIPPEASVSAHFAYVPHLAHRREIYEFPNPWRAANWGDWSREGERLPMANDIEYVLVTESVRDDPENGPIIRRLERTNFERLYQSEGVLLLVRESAREPAE